MAKTWRPGEGMGKNPVEGGLNKGDQQRESAKEGEWLVLGEQRGRAKGARGQLEGRR